ncbi:RES domain-containing protein [Variovorax paradoxus]|nr:RES domain-containing protein [Variovorax paradoxus]
MAGDPCDRARRSQADRSDLHARRRRDGQDLPDEDGLRGLFLTPLPASLRTSASKAAKDDLVVWRLDRAIFAPTWHRGEGAFQVGGRWSPAGRRVVYCALDPSTAILEVAVHKGFKVLDTVAHTLLSIGISKPDKVHVLDVATIPNKNWLRAGTVSAGQQAFGANLLDQHPLVVVPSVVSVHSWNLLIDVDSATGMSDLMASEDFSLDTRLNPP